MVPNVELLKRLFTFTSLCDALSTDQATPFHGKSMENVSRQREWRGAGEEWSEGHIVDGACGGSDDDIMRGIRCHCLLAGYTKKLFSVSARRDVTYRAAGHHQRVQQGHTSG